MRINSIPLVGCPAPAAFSLRLSGHLRIIPDEVREVASHTKQIAELVETNAEQIRATMQKLEQSWEGHSFIRFADFVEDMLRGIKNLAGDIDEFAGKLHAVANRYEEIDKRLFGR